jgi:hypothetical protein
MQDIFGMRPGEVCIQINEYQIVGFAFERDGEGPRAADKPATHNSNFHKPAFLILPLQVNPAV